VNSEGGSRQEREGGGEVREARKQKIINKYKNNFFSIQYRQLLSYRTHILITYMAWADTVDVVWETF
jgi:hypothetical protein